MRSLFELLKQNIRCTQQTIFEYSCKFKQHNTIFLTNNIFLTTRSHRMLKLGFSAPLPSKSHHTLLLVSLSNFPDLLQLMTANTGVFKWDNKRWSNYVTTRYVINNLKNSLLSNQFYYLITKFSFSFIKNYKCYSQANSQKLLLYSSIVKLNKIVKTKNY